MYIFMIYTFWRASTSVLRPKEKGEWIKSHFLYSVCGKCQSCSHPMTDKMSSGWLLWFISGVSIHSVVSDVKYKMVLKLQLLAVLVIPLTSHWEDKGSLNHYATSVRSGHRRCRGQMGILSDKSCWLQHVGTRDQILPQEYIWPKCTNRDIQRNVYLVLHRSCLDIRTHAFIYTT